MFASRMPLAVHVVQHLLRVPYGWRIKQQLSDKAKALIFDFPVTVSY